jgi:hypothetical protein
LTTKLNVIPALVETKLAATMPRRSCRSRKSPRSRRVLTTPTAPNRSRVGDSQAPGEGFSSHRPGGPGP